MKKLSLILLMLLFPVLIYAQCNKDRLPVKTLTDVDSNQVVFKPIFSDIEYLTNTKPYLNPIYNGIRMQEEISMYLINVSITGYKFNSDNDIYVTLTSISNINTTMIAVLPNPECDVMKKSSKYMKMKFMYYWFLENIGQPTSKYTRLVKPYQVEIVGILFYDDMKQKYGANNGVELCPVLNIVITK
jgi:hypothetical protein